MWHFGHNQVETFPNSSVLLSVCLGLFVSVFLTHVPFTNTFQQGNLITIQVDVWLQRVLVGRALWSCLEKCVCVCVCVWLEGVVVLRDRFDSNRTMKRTWSNCFQLGVHLGPLHYLLSLSTPLFLSLTRSLALSLALWHTMSLADSKSLECLINDFVNSGVERFEDGRGVGGGKKRVEKA